MALEITELLKAKLKELQSCKDIKLLIAKTEATRYIKDLQNFQDKLKGAEADDPVIEKWETLLGDIYSLEDMVESLLSHTTPRSQKLLISQWKLAKKIWELKSKVGQIFPSYNSDGEIAKIASQPSCSEESSTVPDPATGSEVEDQQLVAKADSVAQHPPWKALSRKGSDRGSRLGDGDDEWPNASGQIWTDSPYSSEERAAATDVLENLIDALAHPLLSLGTLHFLFLRADISCPSKTILLWAVYNSETVRQHFHVRACINVAEASEIDILKGIVKQLVNDKEEKEDEPPSLQQRLRNFLVWRRYLIILYGDGIKVPWDNLKSAFPNSLNGSRVILAIPSKPPGKAISGTLRENLPESSVFLEDSSITTAKSIMHELTESVLDPRRLLFPISVVGVIGSGKTTLLWPMYEARDVKDHFDCRAWIHVPEDFKEDEVLNDILKQVTGDKTEDRSPIDLLREKLRKVLVLKRYLVVLYDVWKAGIWEDVKRALPNTLNGSRVILAVHEVDVALKTDSWIFKTSAKGWFKDFKGMKEIAPAAKRWFNKPSDSDIMEEASGIVGLRDKIREQAQLVFNSYKSHHLVSVLGMAGSGKTTLVRAFYNSIAAKQHFDCRAWINVPRDFDERDILLDLSKQSLSLEQLQKGLRAFLTWKRYLIVLDDVRSADIWNKLKFTLTNSLNGSRVICTTRNTYLAYHMNPSSVVLALRPLDDDESWELFSKKVTEIDIKNTKPKLKEKILRRCHGLPLTILMLGGLLSKTQQDQWHQVIEKTSKREEKKDKAGKDQLSLGQVVEETSERGEKEITGEDKLNSDQVMDTGKDQLNSGESLSQNVAIETQQASSSGKDSSIEEISTPLVPVAKTQKKEESKVHNESSTSGEDVAGDILSNTVAMSYQCLSHQSKCCLLYLGLFPPAYKIPIRKLFQLWLADGLVVTSSGETSTNEGLAKSCFKELLDGNLIEIEERSVDGRPKTCKVTNSLHDKLFSNAKKVGFLHDESSSESDISTIRRLAGHLEEKIHPVNCIRHLRSYISFCKKRGDAPILGVNELLNNVVKGGFPMLAVLDLEGVYKPLLPKALGKLPMLKYLGLRRTLLDEIPESVGDLPHLETLDIKHTYITTLPGTLWTAMKLQHLYMSEIHVDVSIQKQPPHGSVSKLQTLWGLIIRRKIREKNLLERFGELTKLKLTCVEASIAVVASFTKLESLKLRSIDELNEPAELKLEGIGKLENLSRLYLLGKLLPQPNLDQLPRKLESLTLSVSELSEDPMPKLKTLEKLKVLKLYSRSFIGTEMICDGGFPQLLVLKLWMLEDLKKWTVKGDGMQGLKKVEIRRCKKLENVEGLKELTLTELLLTNMELPFIEKMKQKIGSKKVITQSLTFATE